MLDLAVFDTLVDLRAVNEVVRTHGAVRVQAERSTENTVLNLTPRVSTNDLRHPNSLKVVHAHVTKLLAVVSALAAIHISASSTFAQARALVNHEAIVARIAVIWTFTLADSALVDQALFIDALHLVRVCPIEVESRFASVTVSWRPRQRACFAVLHFASEADKVVFCALDLVRQAALLVDLRHGNGVSHQADGEPKEAADAVFNSVNGSFLAFAHLHFEIMHLCLS